MLIELQPYRQGSLAHRASTKLTKRYFGPYRVLKKVGQVAYRLELPSTARIHDVFLVSLLKQFHGNTPGLPLPLPWEIEASHLVMEPLQVLQRRLES